MSETSITSQLNLTFPESLPINQRRQDIQDAVLNHQVVIIAGETGSGKTTQLPKMLLSLGRGQTQLIGHTQPRRLAARSVAARISAELGVELGGVVGYQVRFTDQQSDQTRLKLMTDGILLAEIQHDRLLKKYDTLIIDEAHERSLNIDFLLGYLKRILPQRPDLKLIVTSATIDVERFSAYFDEAPIIAVEGRTYPVEVHYEDQDQHTFDLTQAVVDRLTLIDMGRYGARGDVLVFLPGEREIRDIAKALKGQESFDVLPLYARLSAAEQNRVFQTTSRRGIRVVLATNVAETSLTVPGIRYVIDPGTARISRYSYRSKLQRLPIEPVSQASANQRKGRCGRVAEGVCIRLYSEDDFLNRPEFTDPEIKRTNLAQVILQMRLLKLGDVQAFPFIEPPDPRLIRDGFTLLNELGAVDPQQALTPLGHQLARLPVDPRLGRMIIAAQKQGALAEILVIVSALAVQDPRERPAEKREQADTLHRRFQHEKSDFLSWIQLWQYLEEQRTELGTNPFRKLCQREFLNYLRIREWRDTHRQLVLACRAYGWAVRDIPRELDYESIPRSTELHCDTPRRSRIRGSTAAETADIPGLGQL
jgi:ATP-dependent helicase HrpA